MSHLSLAQRVALLGANGVEAVRSQSTAGLNVIYVEFNWHVDVRAARQTVQERLSTVAAERALLEADTSRKRRREVIDQVAAGYILQGALDRMRVLGGS